MPKESKLGITSKQYDSKEARAEYQRQWRKLNPGYDRTHRNVEKVREGAWRRRYGVTREDYDAMLERQNGVCGICGTKEPGKGNKYFHIDHDHDTKKVRGLLCDKCNRGIGLLGDNALVVIEAYKYLVGTKYARN